MRGILAAGISMHCQSSANVTVDLHRGIEKRQHRVEHDQDGAGVRQGTFEKAGMEGEPKRARSFNKILAKAKHTVEVGPHGAEARRDGVGRGILTIENDDVGWIHGRRAVREGPARGDARAQVKSHERFAQAWITVEETQFAARQPSGPKPVHRLGRDLTERFNQLQWRRHELAP